MGPSGMITLEGVSKRYGDGNRSVAALTDVALQVAGGEFVAIVGPSGSGKSTLLNLVAGLDVATAGRVVILGHDLERLSDDERSALRLGSMGFIFQTFNLIPTFTATENVAWPRRFKGVAWRDACRQAAVVLSEVGLDAQARDRTPAELSGGEQQRVAIARALVNDPRLVLADEPTGNLDGDTVRAVLDTLVRLNADRGVTVLLVTHNPVAAAYAHRTVELRDGRIVRDAPTRIDAAHEREGRR